MAKRSTNNKILPYQNRSWLNIGTILFGTIFIYMVITFFIYSTQKHVQSYEVTAGSISGDYRYSALAVKDEEIQKASFSGYVTYYAREGARTGAGNAVCAIDEYEKNAKTFSGGEITDEDYDQIRATASSFTLNFTPSSFQDVYNFEADMESYLLQISQNTDATQSYSANQMTAPQSGFVSYTIDGYESLTDDDITADLFNRNNYSATNLRLDTKVKSGDDLYKLVRGEKWYLYFPISADLATALENRTTIRFRFLKDDTTFSSGFSVIQNDGQYFGKLSLRNSLVRYVSDRFLEIELLLDGKEGLKVPSSSITKQTFWKVPEDYAAENKDLESEITFVRVTYGSDGSEKQSRVTTNTYKKLEDGYLVSTDLLKKGDYIQMMNTDKRHQVVDDDLVTIQGVYNINKGYTIFREVTVIDQNEEFCIVRPNYSYGLAAHDYIVLDASEVSENEII